MRTQYSGNTLSKIVFRGPPFVTGVVLGVAVAVATSIPVAMLISSGGTVYVSTDAEMRWAIGWFVVKTFAMMSLCLFVPALLGGLVCGRFVRGAHVQYGLLAGLIYVGVSIALDSAHGRKLVWDDAIMWTIYVATVSASGFGAYLARIIKGGSHRKRETEKEDTSPEKAEGVTH